MTDQFGDDGIKFDLEHRDEILEWASIGKDVDREVRELLGRVQSDVEPRLAQTDPDAVAARHDGGAGNG